jgi:hypothetical protein
VQDKLSFQNRQVRKMQRLRLALLQSTLVVSQILVGSVAMHATGGEDVAYHSCDCVPTDWSGADSYSEYLAACAANGGCIHNTCNMPQHHRYFPQAHGYYYFRPYNSHYIRIHQSAATRYGAPQWNPYSNEIFNDIYAEFERAEAERTEPLPLPQGGATPENQAQESGPAADEPPPSPFEDDNGASRIRIDDDGGDFRLSSRRRPRPIDQQD